MSATSLRLVEKGNMDKQKALDAAIGQIEKAARQRVSVEALAQRQILRHAQHRAGRQPAVLQQHEGRLKVVVEGDHARAEPGEACGRALPLEVDEHPLDHGGGGEVRGEPERAGDVVRVAAPRLHHGA